MEQKSAGGIGLYVGEFILILILYFSAISSLGDAYVWYGLIAAFVSGFIQITSKLRAPYREILQTVILITVFAVINLAQIGDRPIAANAALAAAGLYVAYLSMQTRY